MNEQGAKLVSSKFPLKRTKNEFYRYYAGYPIEFANWALAELALPTGGLVLDPWNGSGTTAAACAGLGFSFRGYDLNPVMVHLARARISSATDVAEARDLVGQVAEILGANTSSDISTVGNCFRDIPVSNEAAHSLAISALFPVARRILGSGRTKNPSWFRKGAQLSDAVISCPQFLGEWDALVQKLGLWRSETKDAEGISLIIERGDSRKSMGRREAYDGFLTSPPYLTRLDYVHATLPEILLLREFDVAPDIQRLRRSMLGSPLTSHRPKESVTRLPNEIRSVLSEIESHSSKASSTYYLRFFSTYFVDLQASLRNLARVIKSGGSGCIVVQSSHYKELEIDLAKAVIIIGREFGLSEYKTTEFTSGRTMALVNSRAHHDARKPKPESAVFLRKR